MYVLRFSDLVYVSLHVLTMYFKRVHDLTCMQCKSIPDMRKKCIICKSSVEIQTGNINQTSRLGCMLKPVSYALVRKQSAKMWKATKKLPYKWKLLSSLYLSKLQKTVLALRWVQLSCSVSWNLECFWLSIFCHCFKS